MASVALIVVRNLSSVVSDDEVIRAVPAFQSQVSRDFASTWGLDAELRFLRTHDKMPEGAWLMGTFDSAEQAGALGYHELTRTGQPLGKVFAKTTLDRGGQWTVTFSHELLEMIVDPNMNLCAFDEEASRLYAYEVCDAVQTDALAYEIDGVKVSDFVLPGWFEPLHVSHGERFAFRSEVSGPFKLLPGGYISYYDLSGGGWQQLTASEQSKPRAAKTALVARATPPPGSRRQRRHLPKAQWLESDDG
jgi:hypothetical protein